MIILNLLPKSKKAELGLAQLYITIKNVIILTLVINISVAIGLLLTKAALQNHFTQVVNQTSLTTQYASSFGQGVKEFNKKLALVEKIQTDYITWTDFFLKFSQLVPDNVIIYSLDINSSKILVTGQAATREALLLLQDNFKNSELFSNVEVPLDNLLKRQDVDFTLRADVKVDNF